MDHLGRRKNERRGTDAVTMGQHTFLHLLSGELHVLALFHVELCRTTKRHTGPRQSRQRQLDYRFLVYRQLAVWRPKQTAQRP